MIGLVLLYFVGRAFYNLAGLHNKSEWGFAILGVLSYYVGIIVGGVIIGILYEVFSPGSLETANDLVLGIMALPIGVLTCWGFYKLLENSWSKQETFAPSSDDNVLDANLDNNLDNNNEIR